MNTMHFDPLSDDEKLNIDKCKEGFQYASISPLTEVNRTRKILLLTIIIEFVVSVISAIVVINSYILGYTLGFESYSTTLRFLPLLSCVCFGFGLIVADRYDAKGLLLFAKLVMLGIIITYLSLTFFLIIPMCFKKYTIARGPTILFAINCLMVFCVMSVLPAYTVRYAYKLAELLTDSNDLTFK